MPSRFRNCGFSKQFFYICTTLLVVNVYILMQQFMVVNKEYNVIKVSAESATYEIPDDSKTNKTHIVAAALKKSVILESELEKSKNNEVNGIEFSACLLVKDENHNIPEWLAYHYYMVQLRHVVICVDPFSESSPLEIAKRWRTQGMTIDVWGKDKFSIPNDFQTITMQRKIDLHRHRQRVCYADCLKHLNKAKRTWTMLIDVDEYLTFNPIANDGSMGRNLWKQVNKSDPNSPYKFLKVSKDGETLSRNDMLMEGRTRVPKSPFSNNINIVKYMEKERNKIPWNDTTCIILPRVQYGTRMDDNNVLLEKGVPKELDVNLFNTLKYFVHNRNTGDSINGPGKCILDVSRMKDLRVANIHRINDECGRRGSAFPDHISSLLRVNHYVGSKEIFLSKEHHQHNEKANYKSKTFHSRSNVNSGKSYDMQGWLELFVNEVGLEKAKHLLDGAGVLFKSDSEGNEINNAQPNQEKASSIEPLSGLINDSNKPTNDKTLDKIDSISHENEVKNGIEFSACLLVKDENHNIPEWLAYHYHMVQLRHLVICVDPFSKTSPLEVTNQWKKYGMTIDVWAEDKFPIPYEYESITRDMQIALHRQRQMKCYTECLEHLNKAKRTWTMLIDIDEYLTFNPIANDGSIGKIGRGVWKQVNETDPNPSYRFAKALKHGESPSRKDILMEARTRVPKSPFLNNKTIVTYLAEEKDKIPWNDSTCIVLPRLQYGDRVEYNKAILEKGVPKGFNMSVFNTLKYFTHHINSGNSINGPGKCIVDVSRLKTLQVYNVHNVNPECGGKGSAFADYVSSLLRVNHYVMSKEIFLSKEHHKHNEESDLYKSKTFDARANVNSGVSYDMQGWLQLFVNEVGFVHAKELLHGAGILNHNTK